MTVSTLFVLLGLGFPLRPDFASRELRNKNTSQTGRDEVQRTRERLRRRANVIVARSLCSHTTHQQARRRAGKSLTPGTPRSGFAICRSAFGCIVVHPSCTPAAYGNLAARRSSSVSSHARLLIASKSLPIPRFWAAASVEVAAHSFLSAIVSSRIWWRHSLSLSLITLAHDPDGSSRGSSEYLLYVNPRRA